MITKFKKLTFDTATLPLKRYKGFPQLLSKTSYQTKMDIETSLIVRGGFPYLYLFQSLLEGTDVSITDRLLCVTGVLQHA